MRRTQIRQSMMNGPPPTDPHYSPDGLWWWDGFQWLRAHPQPQPQHHAVLPTLVVSRRSNSGLWWGAGSVGCLGAICVLTAVLFFPGLFLLALALALAVVAATRGR